MRKISYLMLLSLCGHSVFGVGNNSNPNIKVNTNITASTSETSTQKPNAIKTTASATSEEIDKILNKITPEEDSPLEKNIQSEKTVKKFQHFYYLYKQNYMLPYYYTNRPYQSIYSQQPGLTADNQPLNSSEFKGQISVAVPLVTDLFGDDDQSIDCAFTELIFWQTYVESQYFRSTDTEIKLFYKYHFHKNWLMNIAVDHQSNGKGIPLERSWNRVIGTFQFSGQHFYAESELWFPIFSSVSIAIHNPDIEKYLGHDIFTFGYHLGKLTLAVALQNIEQLPLYGSVTVSAAYPMTDHLNFYLQYFSGYGQTLIEYDHPTQAGGVGFSFNNYL